MLSVPFHYDSTRGKVSILSTPSFVRFRLLTVYVVGTRRGESVRRTVIRSSNLSERWEFSF